MVALNVLCVMIATAMIQLDKYVFVVGYSESCIGNTTEATTQYMNITSPCEVSLHQCKRYSGELPFCFTRNDGVIFSCHEECNLSPDAKYLPICFSPPCESE